MSMDSNDPDAKFPPTAIPVSAPVIIPFLTTTPLSRVYTPRSTGYLQFERRCPFGLEVVSTVEEHQRTSV